MRTPVDPPEILDVLVAHNVEFVVIGGVAATLQGAPIVTFDTDVVHRRTEDNIQRFLGALAELDAYYREHPDWRPKPDAKLLMGRGHHLLETTLGRLDVLGVLTAERDYEALLGETDLLYLASGSQVRVVSLPMLIKLKEELLRDKDRLMLHQLRAALAEREKQQD